MNQPESSDSLTIASSTGVQSSSSSSTALIVSSIPLATICLQNNYAIKNKCLLTVTQPNLHVHVLINKLKVKLSITELIFNKCCHMNSMISITKLRCIGTAHLVVKWNVNVYSKKITWLKSRWNMCQKKNENADPPNLLLLRKYTDIIFLAIETTDNLTSE